MYSVFSFDSIYRTKHGRERTPADMLESVKYGNNVFFMLTNHWGEFKKFKDVIDIVRDFIPGSNYQSYIIGWNEKMRLWEHAYNGVIVYEDDRPIVIY